MTERVLMGGTDGFRGEAVLDQTGPGIVNEETFAGLSAALAMYVKDLGSEGPVVIGMDTRPSSERLKQAAVQGVLSQGLEAIDIGVAPTPAAQRAAKLMGAAATIAITASHNPAKDNGWKGMIGSEKPGKVAVKSISDRYWDLVDSKFKVESSEPAAAEFHDEVTEKYIDDIVGDIQELFGEKPLQGKKIVVDGAHGAGAEVTSTVLNALGADVYEYACGPDGVINEGCGAANLNGLRDFLRHNPELTYDANFLGAVANDGDADRVMGMGLAHVGETSKIVEINGNHIMWAMAQEQPGIVGTEYTNGGLRIALADAEIGFEECPNGDVYVTNALKRLRSEGKPWGRGGEFTGHLVDLNWLSSGDGVRMAAWYSAWAATKNMSFGDMYMELPLWHERMAKILLRDKSLGSAILNASGVLDAAGEYTAKHQDLQFIIRPSGTEPLLRVFGQGKDSALVEEAVDQLAELVESTEV